MFRPHVIFAIASRNIKTFFTDVIGYLFIVVFVAASGLLAFSPGFFADNLATLDKLTEWYPLLLLFLVPAISMGVWADEKRQGTDAILFTLPASDFEILIGKYLSVFVVYAAAIFFSLAQIIALASIGNPDWGVMFSTYLGYLLAGSALLSVGMLASSLTANTTVAFVLGAVFCAVPVLIGSIDPANQFLQSLSVSWQLREFGQGSISLSNVLYFVFLKKIGLFLNYVVITRRHWPSNNVNKLWMLYSTQIASILIVFGSVYFMSVKAGEYLDTELDVTAQRINTLSTTTVQQIREASENGERIEVQAYISEEVPTEFVPVKKRLLRLLRQYAKIGGDSVDLRIVNVVPNSKQEREAKDNKIVQIDHTSEVGGKKIRQNVYLGLVLSSKNGKTIIPQMTPKTPLEYELTRALVTTGTDQRRLKLGVLSTGINFLGGDNGYQFNSLFFDQLKNRYDVVRVSEEDIRKLNVAESEGLENERLSPPDVLLVIRPTMISNGIRVLEAGRSFKWKAEKQETPFTVSYFDDSSSNYKTEELSYDEQFGGYILEPKTDLRFRDLKVWTDNKATEKEKRTGEFVEQPANLFSWDQCTKSEYNDATGKGNVPAYENRVEFVAKTDTQPAHRKFDGKSNYLIWHRLDDDEEMHATYLDLTTKKVVSESLTYDSNLVGYVLKPSSETLMRDLRIWRGKINNLQELGSVEIPDQINLLLTHLYSWDRCQSKNLEDATGNKNVPIADTRIQLEKSESGSFRIFDGKENSLLWPNPDSELTFKASYFDVDKKEVQITSLDYDSERVGYVFKPTSPTKVRDLRIWEGNVDSLAELGKLKLTDNITRLYSWDACDSSDYVDASTLNHVARMEHLPRLESIQSDIVDYMNNGNPIVVMVDPVAVFPFSVLTDFTGLILNTPILQHSFSGMGPPQQRRENNNCRTLFDAMNVTWHGQQKAVTIPGEPPRRSQFGPPSGGTPPRESNAFFPTIISQLYRPIENLSLDDLSFMFKQFGEPVQLKLQLGEQREGIPVDLGSPSTMMINPKKRSKFDPFNRDSVITSGINDLLFFYAGGFHEKPDADSDVQFIPLVSADESALAIPYDDVTRTPDSNGPFRGGERLIDPDPQFYAIEMAIEEIKKQIEDRENGDDSESKDDGASEEEKPKSLEELKRELAALEKEQLRYAKSDLCFAAQIKGKRNDKDIHAVVIADTDFASNLYMAVESVLQSKPDNLDFFMNIVDTLGERKHLVALRSRNPEQRTLTYMENKRDEYSTDRLKKERLMRKELQKKIRIMKEELEQKEKERKATGVQRLFLQMYDEASATEKLNLQIGELEEKRDEQIAELKSKEAENIKETELMVRYMATWLPCLPPLILGLIVLVVRFVQERSSSGVRRRN